MLFFLITGRAQRHIFRCSELKDFKQQPVIHIQKELLTLMNTTQSSCWDLILTIGDAKTYQTTFIMAVPDAIFIRLVDNPRNKASTENKKF